MCAVWRHLVSVCEVKAHLIGCWQYLGAVCFWQPLGWAWLWLSCVTVVSLVAVLRGSVGTSYIVAVLRDRLLWGWEFCLNYNKRGCYVMLYYANSSSSLIVAIYLPVKPRVTWGPVATFCHTLVHCISVIVTRLPPVMSPKGLTSLSSVIVCYQQ